MEPPPARFSAGRREGANFGCEYLCGALRILASLGGRVMRTDAAFISTCALCHAMISGNRKPALKPEAR